MSAGHTPLPWEAASDGCLRRATPSGMDFLRIASPWVESAWNCDETAEANAAFIVRACNSHYELLEALEKAALWFRDYERQHRAKLTDEGNLKADTNEERAMFLEAAIAKARGQ